MIREVSQLGSIVVLYTPYLVTLERLQIRSCKWGSQIGLESGFVTHFLFLYCFRNICEALKYSANVFYNEALKPSRKSRIELSSCIINWEISAMNDLFSVPEKIIFFCFFVVFRNYISAYSNLIQPLCVTLFEIFYLYISIVWQNYHFCGNRFKSEWPYIGQNRIQCQDPDQSVRGWIK